MVNAVIWGHLDICHKLLKADVNPDITDSKGRLPLVEAARHGNLEICSLLLKSGANPDAFNRDGKLDR